MIVGTAGHIDHGKTALLHALTGQQGDRRREERERGITIDLGYLYADLGEGSLTGFIDVPGHERFVHNMLAGASGIDCVLLVVAADDGVMPQTREHLAIVELLGIRRALVALTKIDRVEPARIAEVEQQIENLLAAGALAGAPIFPVSSIRGDGIDALRAALIDEAARTAARSDSGHFRRIGVVAVHSPPSWRPGRTDASPSASPLALIASSRILPGFSLTATGKRNDSANTGETVPR